jgi:hypothetical protein
MQQTLMLPTLALPALLTGCVPAARGGGVFLSWKQAVSTTGAQGSHTCCRVKATPLAPRCGAQQMKPSKDVILDIGNKKLTPAWWVIFSDTKLQDKV